jgi:hypothetical protein
VGLDGLAESAKVKRRGLFRKPRCSVDDTPLRGASCRVGLDLGLEPLGANEMVGRR